MPSHKSERADGPNLALCLIHLDDAEYIYDLRSDPYRWMKSCKTNKTARALNFVTSWNAFRMACPVALRHWGRAVPIGNKPSKSVLESAMSYFGIGFSILFRRV